MPSSLTLLVTGLTTGLLAGGASCAAVQGGLLAGAVTRRASADAAPARVATLAGARRSTTKAAPPAPPEPKALAPVGAFLAGKLVSHALLGALLGVFGDVLQPSPRARAVMLVVAGLLMVLFALDLFGVKAVARFVPRAPASFGRLFRRSAKTESLATPALIGLTTVLVPCGVTLSVELIAVTSGSPVAGAAVMAGFVIGTAPLFAVLGYLFRRSTRALSGQLASLTGVVVLAVAVWTVASGLQAGGWVALDSSTKNTSAAVPVFSPEPSSGESADSGAEAQEPAPNDVPVRVDASGRQVITLTVTDFYTPTQFTAKAGLPTTLILRGKDSGGCARAFTIPELGVQEIVERNGDTVIDLGTRDAGKLMFSCAMGMQTGSIDFEKA
ncbi:sulfite exporter TauE/SafE family protein [Streptomyces roseoviridis]|uniref:Sulfite exporter TauE/SafE family protein n=1 Tax=Streptomyces roseoviridis TaxID=67361 RepID=A0ABV5QW97_9ACTN